MKFNSYLLFNGDCEAAFNFYAKTLGGKIEMKMTHGESPMAAQVPPEWQSKIMHTSLTVGDQALMASDAPPGRYQKPQGFSVSISIDDAKEAERIFKAFAEGGQVVMPFQPTFWAFRFGMVVDRFGTPWMINCEKES